MAIQPDEPSSKYNASHHTNPPFATRKKTSTSVAARPGHTNLRIDYRRVTRSRRPPASDGYSARHAPFGRKRRGSLATSRPGAIQAGAAGGPTRRAIGDASRVAPIRGPSQAGLPGTLGDAISSAMFVVTEADAAAIRAVSIRRANYRPPSSCAAGFPVSPTTRRHAPAPGPSPAGRRRPCRYLR